MSNNIIELPAGVTYRSCPGCRYLISQTQVDAARLNFDCPRCEAHKLSEFQPIKTGGAKQ